MPSAAEKSQYATELTTLLSQRSTAVSNLASAESSYASARDLRKQRVDELDLIERKIQDRKVWISN